MCFTYCILLQMAPVIEKYKLPPIQIFDKNCPLKRVNQKFAIFRQNVRILELFGNIKEAIFSIVEKRGRQKAQTRNQNKTAEY